MPSFNTDISSEVISKFKIKTSVFNINNKKSYENSQCVSTLLNTSNWTNYIDSSKGTGQYAIGGPTVELWMESWNARYPSNILYCNNANSNGYYVGTDNIPTSTSVTLGSNMNNGGELYFANNNTPLTDGNSTVNYYWIASPSAYNSDIVLYVYYNGYGDYYSYSSRYGGLRPVVCLTSNISLKN